LIGVVDDRFAVSGRGAAAAQSREVYGRVVMLVVG